MGLVFASVITNTFSIFGQGQITGAPKIIGEMFAGSSLLIGILYVHSYRRSAIRLTNRRASVRTGPLLGRAGEIDLEQVHLAVLREPLLGRLLNYGTVSIVGPAGLQFRMRFVPKPNEFYDRLNDLLRNRQ